MPGIRGGFVDAGFEMLKKPISKKERCFRVLKEPLWEMLPVRTG